MILKITTLKEKCKLHNLEIIMERTLNDLPIFWFKMLEWISLMGVLTYLYIHTEPGSYKDTFKITLQISLFLFILYLGAKLLESYRGGNLILFLLIPILGILLSLFLFPKIVILIAGFTLVINY